MNMPEIFFILQIYAEAESRANEFIQFAMPRREQYFWPSGQIYAEAESRANEFIQFAMPRRNSICGEAK